MCFKFSRTRSLEIQLIRYLAKRISDTRLEKVHMSDPVDGNGTQRVRFRWTRTLADIDLYPASCDSSTNPKLSVFVQVRTMGRKLHLYISLQVLDTDLKVCSSTPFFPSSIHPTTLLASCFYDCSSDKYSKFLKLKQIIPHDSIVIAHSQNG